MVHEWPLNSVIARPMLPERQRKRSHQTRAVTPKEVRRSAQTSRSCMTRRNRERAAGRDGRVGFSFPEHEQHEHHAGERKDRDRRVLDALGSRRFDERPFKLLEIGTGQSEATRRIARQNVGHETTHTIVKRRQSRTNGTQAPCRHKPTGEPNPQRCHPMRTQLLMRVHCVRCANGIPRGANGTPSVRQDHVRPDPRAFGGLRVRTTSTQETESVLRTCGLDQNRILRVSKCSSWTSPAVTRP